MSETFTDQQGTPKPERRQHKHLRAIFDNFRAIAEPFIRTDSVAWGATDLSYFARRQIQEAYPNLSSQEINVLLVAVARVVNEERNQSK